MGKPGGFMEYQRETAVTRDPIERLKDWQAFYTSLPEAKLKNQAARCMDCGTPFCHNGCPNHNLPPEWNELIYRGLWREAYYRLSKTNNFPEFTGRVCPALCEGSCTVGLIGSAVTIKDIERAIIEKAFAEGWVAPQPPAQRTGKRVAVVGSGPSGLACADQLNKAGHSVTVFEKADRVGGLLMYGIPNMKLEKKYVQRRVELMTAEGVQFVTGTEVGKDYPAAQLLTDFDAVVLCGGATKPRELVVEGSKLAGVHYAVEFLGANTRSLLNSNHRDGQFISATGKDVIIIGGGDTGTDCVGTALRQGCRSVAQLEIMPQLPPTRGANNPWPEYPRIHKVDYGQQEAMAVQGDDPRHYNTMTKRIVGDELGRVKEVHTVQVEWIKNNEGRLVPQEVPGSEKIWPAQLVLIAMGFTGPEDLLLDQLGVARDERSNAKADYGKFATNLPGVFAAGDMRRGQSLVIWAINEGRGAARECDRYLMGETFLP